MTMAVDLRQLIAALLTLSMFIMLGNMIKKDHIDPILVNVQKIPSQVQHDLIKVSKQHLVKLTSLSNGPWKEDHEILKPCWGKPSQKVRKQAKGYIFFSLTIGPEYHATQISIAILIAKHIGAALILPDIVGIKAGERRLFDEVYDINKFVTSLDGIVQVVKDYPSEETREKIITVRVPYRISKEFIAKNIEPIFKRHRQLRISISSTLGNAPKNKYMTPYECLAMFGSLELQRDLQELVNSMVRTLQSLGSNSFGKFISLDWDAKELKKRNCQRNFTMNKCFDVKEIGKFFKKIGVGRDTPIYFTRWHESLNLLRDDFPNTFTKEAIMPIDMKPKYLGLENFEVEKFIDFNLCMQSDVFVTSSNNQFQVNVIGKRIASGKTQIFELARRTSTSTIDYLSPYITKKSHMAYSCFC